MDEWMFLQPGSRVVTRNQIKRTKKPQEQLHLIQTIYTTQSANLSNASLHFLSQRLCCRQHIGRSAPLKLGSFCVNSFNERSQVPHVAMTSGLAGCVGSVFREWWNLVGRGCGRLLLVLIGIRRSRSGLLPGFLVVPSFGKMGIEETRSAFGLRMIVG